MDIAASTRRLRADLAAALEDLATTDRSVARVLAACEAWESGYVARLLTRAETLLEHDPVDPRATTWEQALDAIDRAIRQDNPFQRVRTAGVHPSDEAIAAILDFLHQQAKFHETAGDLERRAATRFVPPGHAAGC